MTKAKIDQPKPIKNWQELIDRFDGPSEFGRVIKVSKQTAHDMKMRGFIRSNYWKQIVAAAEERGWDDIDFEMLGRLAAEHPPGMTSSK